MTASTLIERLRDMANGPVSDRPITAGRLCAEAADHIAALEAALLSLSNEVDALGYFERPVRLVVGNTNYSCLMRRVEEARVALKAAP